MTILCRFTVTILAAGACASLLAPGARSQSSATFPLSQSCGSGEAVAAVRASDPVKVRYSFSTDTATCYAVTVTVEGKALDGYLLGGADPEAVHPAVLAFEKEARSHVPQIPAPPPAPPPAAPTVASTAPKPPAAASPKEAPPETPKPLSFAGFRAVDVNGNRVDLSAKRAPNIVLYFWSAGSPAAIKKAEAMEGIYDTYHRRGVEVVGIASAKNADQLRQVCSDNEVLWPEILDYGGIASRYHVDPANPYLVLDQSRNVIAAVSSATGLEAILQPLTKNRRASQ